MSLILTNDDSRLLFRALTANGAFSLLSGLAMLLTASTLAGLIGVAEPRWLIAIGAGLVGFGGHLLWLVRRKRIRHSDAIAISAADLAWVVGSLLLVALWPGQFTGFGIVAVLSVALIVLAFFELQAYALWQHRRQ